jgi:hypothetical protein
MMDKQFEEEYLYSERGIAVRKTVEGIRESAQRVRDLGQSIGLGDSGGLPEGYKAAEIFREMLIVLKIDEET